MKLVTIVFSFIVLLLVFAIYLQSKPKLIALSIQGNTIFCEIADTPEKRNKGLMFRDSLAKNQGMIFTYHDEQIRTYHMQNVKFPIDIAFANAQGVIVDIQSMDTDPNKKYPSKAPAQYALEANKDWFALNKITIGHKIEGLENTITTTRR